MGCLKFLKDIVLPLSVLNIAALSIIVFVYGWNHYLWPLLFTTDIEMSTVIISLKSLLPGPEDPAEWWTYTMAGAFIVMLPPVLVIPLLQRWFARGLDRFREVSPGIDVCNKHLLNTMDNRSCA